MTKKRPKKKHISRAVYSLSLFDQQNAVRNPRPLRAGRNDGNESLEARDPPPH